jgi:hypothetical protein
VLAPYIILRFGDIDELRVELNALLLRLLPLDAHDPLDTVPNIELVEDLSELIRLDLGIVKQVLHHEGHDVGR